MLVGIPHKRCFGEGLCDFLDFLPNIALTHVEVEREQQLSNFKECVTGRELAGHNQFILSTYAMDINDHVPSTQLATVHLKEKRRVEQVVQPSLGVLTSNLLLKNQPSLLLWPTDPSLLTSGVC